MPFPPACNCHGHAHDCYYDPEVDRRGASQNSDDVYQGGGVCVDCQVGWVLPGRGRGGARAGEEAEGGMTGGWGGESAGLRGPALPQHHTTGINCERCLPGFYRDPDQPLDSPRACHREWGPPGGRPGCRGVCRSRMPRSFTPPWGAWPPCPDRMGGGGDRPALGPRIARGWGLMTPRPPGCSCESDFTDGTCEDLTGRCYCRPNFTGERCDACAEGFAGFPLCYREHAACGRGAPHSARRRLADAPPLPRSGVLPQQHRGAGPAGRADRE